MRVDVVDVSADLTGGVRKPVTTVDEVMQLLKARGYRRTVQRERIIAILMKTERPLTAREIHESVVRRFPQMSLDTVYRNLELLREAGLVTQINLQNRESARFELHEDGDHHHHLVCIDCGRSVCLPVCPIDRAHLEAAAGAEFTLLNHAFEMYGRCARCSA